MNYRVSYCTYEFEEIDIHLRTLRNRQEYGDDDGEAENLGISSAAWPIFGVVWPSSIVLAHYMLSRNIQKKRILEVGCGIGLTSLLLNHLKADITATDHHPEAQRFLDENTRLNRDIEIPFVRTGWGDDESELGEYDLIIGSDLLYEDEHVELLSQFINQHCKQKCEVIVVDPGRGRHRRFSRKMEMLGFDSNYITIDKTSDLDVPFGGKVLSCRR